MENRKVDVYKPQFVAKKCEYFLVRTNTRNFGKSEIFTQNLVPQQMIANVRRYF
jgi:hypothetical protein